MIYHPSLREPSKNYKADNEKNRLQTTTFKTLRLVLSRIFRR